jgi:hypothetical protein
MKPPRHAVEDALRSIERASYQPLPARPWRNGETGESGVTLTIGRYAELVGESQLYRQTDTERQYWRAVAEQRGRTCAWLSALAIAEWIAGMAVYAWR